MHPPSHTTLFSHRPYFDPLGISASPFGLQSINSLGTNVDSPNGIVEQVRSERYEAGNHCQQSETNREEDEPRTDKQPSVPDAITNNSSNSFSFTSEDAITNNSSNSFSFTSEDFLGYGSEEENTNPNPLIERSEDATKKALEQSEERVRLLEEELAKSRKECKNWSARTSFVSRRLKSLMIESDKNQSGWVKALRELEKERELVRLLKMECEEIRQSSMRQVEKKEQELAISLNATAAAKKKLSDLEMAIKSLDDKEIFADSD